MVFKSDSFILTVLAILNLLLPFAGFRVGYYTDVTDALGILFIVSTCRFLLFIITAIFVFIGKGAKIKGLTICILVFSHVLHNYILSTPGNKVLQGFTHQVKNGTLTEGEWHQFAQTYKTFRDSITAVDTTIKDIERWERRPENQQMIWKYMESNSAISKYYFKGSIFYSHGFIGVVNGGGFIGGWGVKVYVDENKFHFFDVAEYHEIKIYDKVKTFHYPG